jgi:P-type Na+/K+ transporter
MVAKKAWIPDRGTYSVGNSNEPINPTIGDLMHSTLPPQQTRPAEKANDGDVSDCTSMLDDNNALRDFLYVASLANLAHVHKTGEGEWKVRGDPTEIALQVFALRFEFDRVQFVDKDNPQFKLIAEYPFDSDVKKMSVIFERLDDQSQMVYTKGAVERVIHSCGMVKWGANSLTQLTDKMKDEILENMEALASHGLRVLALASRSYNTQQGRRASRPEPPPRDDVEKDLVFRGLIGLYDPPRPESAEAVKSCHRAGIAVHMLTGDHPGTARAIADQVGIVPNMDRVSKPVADAMVMTAKHFDSLSDTQVDQLPVLPLVIARCAPNTKVRMIEALHRRKAFAAMVSVPHARFMNQLANIGCRLATA